MATSRAVRAETATQMRAALARAADQRTSETVRAALAACRRRASPPLREQLIAAEVRRLFGSRRPSTMRKPS
jgi:hypothetical protein